MDRKRKREDVMTAVLPSISPGAAAAAAAAAAATSPGAAPIATRTSALSLQGPLRKLRKRTSIDRETPTRQPAILPPIVDDFVCVDDDSAPQTDELLTRRTMHGRRCHRCKRAPVTTCVSVRCDSVGGFWVGGSRLLVCSGCGKDTCQTCIRLCSAHGCDRLVCSHTGICSFEIADETFCPHHYHRPINHDYPA
ncbi:hypothetical protein PYCC9005_000683 [Savitreella phatthalungensis]